MPGPQIFQSRHGLMDLVMEDLASDGIELIYSPLRELRYGGDAGVLFHFTLSICANGETCLFVSSTAGANIASDGAHLIAFAQASWKSGERAYSGGEYEGDDVQRVQWNGCGRPSG